jgi:membrane associated rhomboid family serine protease
MPLTLLPYVEDEASVTREAQLSSPETKLDRLLKMIPTEVIAVYPAVLATAAVIAWPYYEPSVAILGLLGVILVLWYDGVANKLKPDRRQYIVRCLAFAAWTLVLGNPLAPLSVTAAQAHIFGAVGAAFIPVLGYLTLPVSPASS